MKTIDVGPLRLRSWHNKDAKDLFDYAKHDLVGPMAGWKPHESVEESQRIIELFIKQQDVWAIEHIASRKVIGSIGLHQDHKRQNQNARMIGFVLHSNYWGQGIMVQAAMAVMNYAFYNEPIDCISVYHFPSNYQSKRVIEKCGFIYEGTLRRVATHVSGTVVDHCCYSITKEEYIHFISTQK
jgi:[ribosomal protein S5]-alanine N-acetyltransferase